MPKVRGPRSSRYAPFNMQLLNGNLYATYGLQNKKKTNVVAGACLGVVDEYSVNDKLMEHLVSNSSDSPLDEPWGLAIAPLGTERRQLRFRRSRVVGLQRRTRWVRRWCARSPQT
jgi:hypothetical protein